jgi:hypothetical protein
MDEAIRNELSYTTTTQQLSAIRSPKEAGNQYREMVCCIQGSFTSVVGGEECGRPLSLLLLLLLKNDSVAGGCRRLFLREPDVLSEFYGCRWLRVWRDTIIVDNRTDVFLLLTHNLIMINKLIDIFNY